MQTAPKDKSKLRIPPTYKGAMGLGAARKLNKPLELYSEAFRQYGDVVRFTWLGVDWYFLAHPDGIEHVLQTHQQNFRKPDSVTKNFSLVSGNGLFNSEGEFWLRQRRLEQPAFHREKLEKMSSVFVDSASCLVDEWKAHKEGDVVDLLPEMMRLSLKMVSLSLFGKDVSSEADIMHDALMEISTFVDRRINDIIKWPTFLPLPRNLKFRKAKIAIDQVVADIIATRRKMQTESDDLLSTLMLAKDQATGEAMSDQQLRDEVNTLLLAGHDTTAASLVWTWYLLSENPDCWRKLQAELQSVLGGRKPKYEDLTKLTYTRMVYDEALRIFPPAWGQARQSINDDEIMGYFIPKGSIIALSQYVTHRHPQFWHQAEKFQPERFSPEEVQNRPKFAYFPFGGGQRMCIGNNLAIMESVLAIATIAQHFELQIVKDQIIEAEPRIVLRPKYGMKATLRRLTP